MALFAIDGISTSINVLSFVSTQCAEDVGVNSNVDIGEEDVPL